MNSCVFVKCILCKSELKSYCFLQDMFSFAVMVTRFFLYHNYFLCSPLCWDLPIFLGVMGGADLIFQGYCFNLNIFPFLPVTYFGLLFWFILLYIIYSLGLGTTLYSIRPSVHTCSGIYIAYILVITVFHI